MLGPVRSAYDILGLARGATPEAVRRAYRTLAKTAHPDQAGDTPEAHDAFLEIRAAYEILADPLRRAAYDLDPTGLLEHQVDVERRRQRIRRRRMRIMRLYE